MAQPLITSGMALCSFGVAPSAILGVAAPTVLIENKPVVVMSETLPANIPPFGVCTSLSNPTVAAATTAALGVLTPMPCVPTIVTPWLPSSPTVMACNKPVVNNTSKCMCAYGGVVTITFAGAVLTQVP